MVEGTSWIFRTFIMGLEPHGWDLGLDRPVPVYNAEMSSIHRHFRA